MTQKGKKQRRKQLYKRTVRDVAKLCSTAMNPDKRFHRIASGRQFTRKQFNDVMDFGNHPDAYANLLGDPVEIFSHEDWHSVIPLIAYLGFRADVLEKVSKLKEGTN